MPETKSPPMDDKTLLKDADDIAQTTAGEEDTPSKEFAPYLVIIDGLKQGTRFILRDGENLIGRSPSSVAILEDQSVSRRHGMLIKTKAGWLLQDAGSKNGCKLNGQKIKEPVNIGHGDIIQVGIYALRLITKPVSAQEEMAALPSDLEGKTVMFSQSKKEGSTGVTDTRTMLEASSQEERKTEDFTPEEAQEVAPTERDTAAIPVPQEEPEKIRSPLITYLAMGLSLLIVIAIGGYAYWNFLGKSPAKAPIPSPGSEPKVLPTMPVIPEGPSKNPLFLDFASSPMPARIYMEGKDYGLAPVKVNMELEEGKTYTAQAVFNLEEIQDTKELTVSFTVEKDATSIPILFKGPIGIIKVGELPRETQLYIEGYYADDPFKPHTAKLHDVVFNKPIYLPYGRYIIELRYPKKLGDSNQFVDDLRYKREIKISEEAPLFELSVADSDLEVFPVEIRSIPENADVFMDGTLKGKTPFKGNFPLGEHTLTLRKDGYFEYTQSLKMDINTIYQAEISLKTTMAGEYINSASIMMNKGLYKEAIAKLSEAFNKTPTVSETAQIQYLLGSCYLSLGDLPTAIGYFEQARQSDEFKLPAMLGLASIYGFQKDIAKALPLLVEVMLKAQDENLKRDANGVFKQLSPLRSVMYIWTDPQGATVSVNDKPMDQKTPMILHDLGMGNYKIRIQKDGYQAQDLNISMSIAEFNPIIVRLKPVEE